MSNTHSTADFVKLAKEVHGNKFDYSKVVYIKAVLSVIITCPEHEDFYQTPSGHLKGSGCPSCTNYGFKSDIPAILYYLRVERKGMITYKIGITNRTVTQRFGRDMQYITVLQISEYQFGVDARREEQKLIKEFVKYKYAGPKLLESGNTELFIKDILQLDTIRGV